MAIILLSGKAGSNREAVAQLLVKEHGYSRLTTLTTREPLLHEQVGEAYCFTSTEHFKQLESYGMLMEHTEYRGKHYGITKAKLLSVIEDNKNVVVTLTPSGVEKLKKYLSANHIPHAAVYLDCPTEECIKQLTTQRAQDSLSERQYLDRICSLATEEGKWDELANRSSIFDIITECDPEYDYDAEDTVGLISFHSERLNRTNSKKLKALS